MKKSYSDKLKDMRWQQKRLEILNRAGWKCECCHRTGEGISLHIHHAWYKKGYEPWDYPNESLRALCEDCHQRFELARQEFLDFISTAGPAYMMIELLEALNDSLGMGCNPQDLARAIVKHSLDLDGGNGA